jgi:acetyl esterase/lipase
VTIEPAGPALGAVAVVDHSVPGPAGSVPIRTYWPRSAPAGVGLLWIHGGGFGSGDLDMPEADAVSRALAEAGVTVVSTHYRLAVDGVHFPACSDDVLAVWRWLAAGTDPELPQVVWSIGGASAGANLAASVCLQARDLGTAMPRGAVLVYPGMHGVLQEPSGALAAKLHALPPDRRIVPEVARTIALAYVGDEALLHHPYAFPGEGELEGFPPSLVINAELDGLRVSGEAFGAQLVTAGVDTAVLCLAGAEHAFLNDPDLAAFDLGVKHISHWLLRCPLAEPVHSPHPESAHPPHPEEEIP